MLMIDSKIDNLLEQVFELAPERACLDLTPDDVELWDSLNHLRLVTAIEEAFEIKFQMREVMEMTSLSRIREIVGRRVRQ